MSFDKILEKYCKISFSEKYKVERFERLIKADGKEQLLFDNTEAQVDGAEKFIQIQHIRNCFKAHPEYGQGLAKGLGLAMDKVNSIDLTPYYKWALKPDNNPNSKCPS